MGLSAAALAFQDELARLGVEPEEGVGRRAARLVAAEAVWADALGPMLTSGDVQELLGISREALRQRVEAGKVLALPTRQPRERAYPAFQFHRGSVLPGLPEALREFLAGPGGGGGGGVAVSPHTLAAWLVGPKRALEGLRPVDWLARGRDPERVAKLARQAAARLAH